MCFFHRWQYSWPCHTSEKKDGNYELVFPADPDRYRGCLKCLKKQKLNKISNKFEDIQGKWL